MNKMALGTVQFGLNYGIGNKTDKISPEKAYEILDYAYENNIRTIDTAYGYGDSEVVLGNYFKNTNKQFNIISKINKLDNKEEIIEESFKRLNQEKLYGFLVHDFVLFREDPSIFEILKKFKESGKIKKIGFSLYYPEDLEFIFEKAINFDIVQIPYSIFDRRFEKYFPLMKEKQIKIHIRSVFLQGLFFKNPEDLSKHFDIVNDKITFLHQLSLESSISIASLCLNYTLLNSKIDKVVIGVDNLKHLKENLDALNDKVNVNKYLNPLNTLQIDDLNILLPHFWKTE